MKKYMLVLVLLWMFFSSYIVYGQNLTAPPQPQTQPTPLTPFAPQPISIPAPTTEIPPANCDDKCVEKLKKCQASGGSPDRCFCKAIGGISLNTNVPFIGNCISLTKSSSPNTTSLADPTDAFPRLMGGLSKLVMTIILIFCFLAIIVGGVLISMGGADEAQATKGKEMIRHVVIALALLGASGVILRIINPSFFG